MRLCTAKRFVTAAEMSLETTGMKFVGLQRFEYQSFVQGKLYSRLALTGWCAVAPGASGSVHASEAIALFPRVVKVGTLSCESKSHGERDARFVTSSSQPGMLTPWIAASQHQSLRVSVPGRFQG